MCCIILFSCVLFVIYHFVIYHFVIYHFVIYQFIEYSSIIVGGNIINASLTVKNLGVVLDRHLTMAYQVSKIVSRYKLRLVNIIRDKLSVHVAERVMNAMVTGNLDYCNSLLHGIIAGQLGRIQKLQNIAARQFQESIVDVLIQVIVEDVLYGFIFHLGALLIYLYSALNDVTC